MLNLSRWFRSPLAGASFLICAVLGGGDAQGVTITVSGSFEITEINTSLGPGQIVEGDRFNFTLTMDGSVQGDGQPRFPQAKYTFEDVVTSAIVTRDPGNTGIFDPGFLSLIGSEASGITSDTIDAFGINAYFDGFGPIEGESQFALLIMISASVGTAFDPARPVDTSLEDYWRTPSSLEDYDGTELYAALGRPYTSDTRGTYSSLAVAIPEPGTVTMLMGASVLGALVRRRPFRK